MSQIKIGKSKINLIDVGSGPAILLVHGFPLDHSMWKYQIEPLSEMARVICPDLPGFGHSQSETDPVSMRTPVSIRGFADHLIELIDELKIEQVTFCGLSMGGYIGWQFCKYHPTRVHTLIACNTRAAADGETVARGRRVSAESVLAHGTRAMAEDMPAKLFSAHSLQHRTDDVELIRKVIAGTKREVVAQAQLAMGERPDATDWLAQIKIPTLFIVGEHDTITPPEEMIENANLVANSQFVCIENAGHLTPLENPDAFNRAVIEFMARWPIQS